MNLKTIVSDVAPVLGSVIGSLNPIAGVAYNLICKAFGVETSTPPDNLATTIQNDPEHDIKLKQIETEHLDLLTQAQKEIQLGAYNREIEVVKASGGKSDWVLHVLAIIFTIGFFGYLSVDIFSPKHFSKDIFSTITTMEMLVLGYYFGSAYLNKK